MFALLSGTVISVHETTLVLDVGGVGYELLCSTRTLARLPVGHAARLHCHLHVREDALTLFGFADAAEKGWFLLLLTITGVGPKVAVAMLSALSAEELTDAITLQQPKLLTRASGVGARLAERIVHELKDKLGGMAPMALSGLGAAVAGTAPGAASLASDVISALTNLGYREAEAARAVTGQLKAAPAAGFDGLFKASLRQLQGS